jgi:hypothetical protein
MLCSIRIQPHTPKANAHLYQ